MIPAIVFDLYGTLLRIGRPRLHKRVPRALGIKARPWVDLVRRHLLTREFADEAEFVRFICDSRAPDRSPEAEETCRSLVADELVSVEPFEGVFSLLRFLKRRGHRLGLISNLTSVHKQQLHRWELAELFDAVALSCELGICKPDPRMFTGLCERLGVETGAVLMVGDSLRNDVVAARQLGMRAVQVGGNHDDGIARVSELGWLHLSATGDLEHLVRNGVTVRLGGAKLSLRGVRALPDPEQGRYNLVAVARGSPSPPKAEAAAVDAEAGVSVYCKRFLLPEAAYVEEFAREMLELIDLPSCAATVLDGPEPCLVMAEVAGEKIGGAADPAMAYEMGRHCASGYIFANADLRPRNVLLSWDGNRPVLTMIDLEHFFFNLALDVTGLDDPMRPETIERLSPEELVRRLRHKVLNERTTRRAMRTFVELESLETDVARSFRAGWLATYARAKQQCEHIYERMEERIHVEPFLIIGTRAYRRAMARIDIDDVRDRIGQDPEKLFPRLAAVRRKKRQ